VSTATFIVKLASAPLQEVVNQKEVLQAFAETPTPEPVVIQITANTGTSIADRLNSKKQGDLVIISGSINLDDSGKNLVMNPHVLCDAHPDQFLNEINIVGRLGGEPKQAEKSCRRSVAENRYSGKDPATGKAKENTDWWLVRGYKFNRTKLEKAPKGSLVSISGTVVTRKNKDDQPYIEITMRKMTSHKRGKGGAAPDPAANTTAVGYDPSAFEGDSDDNVDDLPSNWN